MGCGLRCVLLHKIQLGKIEDKQETLWLNAKRLEVFESDQHGK